MKKLVIISLTLILASGILVAQRSEGMHCNQPEMPKPMNMSKPMMHPDAMMNCMDELKLTDAQKKKFEELRITFLKTENSLTAEIENLKIDLRSAIKAENFKQAKEINKQIATKETTLQDARLDFLAARMKELSPEQKEIMKKNMLPMMMQRHNMMQNCKGPSMMQMKQKNNANCGDCKENDTMQMKHKKQDNCNDCSDSLKKHDCPNPKLNKTK